jgi:hypothetical protein
VVHCTSADGVFLSILLVLYVYSTEVVHIALLRLFLRYLYPQHINELCTVYIFIIQKKVRSAFGEYIVLGVQQTKISYSCGPTTSTKTITKDSVYFLPKQMQKMCTIISKTALQQYSYEKKKMSKNFIHCIDLRRIKCFLHFL